MNLDLRLPMGLMFTLTGLLLVVFGLSTEGSQIYQKSLGYNANLLWGFVLLVFGLVMFILGRRGQLRMMRQPQQPRPEGEVRRGGH